MPTDTPSPLAAAAEAVVAAAATSTIYAPVEPLALRQALTTLRAALDAEAAWRARAEAAILFATAKIELESAEAANRRWTPDGRSRRSAAMKRYLTALDRIREAFGPAQKGDVYIAEDGTRRRYEETCRAG